MDVPRQRVEYLAEKAWEEMWDHRGRWSTLFGGFLKQIGR